ncbi:Ankyrin repeat domain-containing protein [Dorcoceras hygrometricum]|uniref:Ankyrin repeat domain-containing protein n=1 Tax=Dorcoceras hygrometricum TaxID=472368 RepID=A0A2Z6ZY87_9LAMI|nr:Ankyrin repeat domain-containing protein [Dorcoceras hygrometricum]
MAQPSADKDEKPAQGQQGIEDVPMKIAEHEASLCDEEMRSKPVLEQQAQDLEQRVSDQIEEHLAQEKERQAPIETKEQ